MLGLSFNRFSYWHLVTNAIWQVQLMMIITVHQIPVPDWCHLYPLPGKSKAQERIYRWHQTQSLSSWGSLTRFTVVLLSWASSRFAPSSGGSPCRLSLSTPATLTWCTGAYIQRVHAPYFPSPLWGTLGASPLLKSFSLRRIGFKSPFPHGMAPFPSL